jgi:adenylyl-sulfate kinase
MTASNVVWHEHRVNKEKHSQLKKQHPCILWFTGLSGAGKSTIAGAVEQKLYELGHHTYLLDGDNVRHGLNGDLGFSDKDRVENIRRIGEMAKLFADAGLIVLSAFISPFRADRQMVRELVENDEFIEVFMDTPLMECEQRDPKGLYQKARAGEIKNFTGIDSEYEIPREPEIIIKSADFSIEECAEQVIQYLKNKKLIFSK